MFGKGGAGEVAVLDTAAGEWTIYRVPGRDGAVPEPRVGPVMVRLPARTNSGLSDIAQQVFVHQRADRTSVGDWTLMWGGDNGDATVWKLAIAAPPLGASTLPCPYIFDLRAFHGAMMFLSWGVFLPVGVAVARYAKSLPNALWFRIHRPLQVTGVLFSIGGFVASYLMVPIGHYSARPHAIIGLLVFALGLFQPLNALVRPHPEPRTRRRVAWELVHKNGGRVAVVLGLINPFYGLKHIQAGPALSALYATWFALFWATVVVLEFRLWRQSRQSTPAPLPTDKAASGEVALTSAAEPVMT